MAEFENGRSEFKGWSKSRRKIFLNELVEIIKPREIYGVASALVMEDYNQLSESEKSRITYGKPEAPYYLCFQHCVSESAIKAEELAKTASEKVAFVFDLQNEFSGKTLEVYRDLRNTKDWTRRERL